MRRTAAISRGKRCDPLFPSLSQAAYRRASAKMDMAHRRPISSDTAALSVPQSRAGRGRAARSQLTKRKQQVMRQTPVQPGKSRAIGQHAWQERRAHARLRPHAQPGGAHYAGESCSARKQQTNPARFARIRFHKVPARPNSLPYVTPTSAGMRGGRSVGSCHGG